MVWRINRYKNSKNVTMQTDCIIATDRELLLILTEPKEGYAEKSELICIDLKAKYERHCKYSTL